MIVIYIIIENTPLTNPKIYQGTTANNKEGQYFKILLLVQYLAICKIMNDDQPYPIKIFLDKLKYFTIFNIIYALWACAETIFYGVVTADISCSQMKNIFTAWTFSYVFQVFVPIACLLIVRYSKYYRGGYAFIIAMCIYKAGVIITVLALAWRHVGLCYITYSMRVTIILTNCLQIICLVVQLILLVRIKQVNRQILLNNLIKKKTFAQN